MVKHIQIPWLAEYALRVATGLGIYIVLMGMASYAWAQEIIRSVRGLPDAGAPRPTSARVTPLQLAVAASEQQRGDAPAAPEALAAAESLDGAADDVTEITSQDGQSLDSDEDVVADICFEHDKDESSSPKAWARALLRKAEEERRRAQEAEGELVEVVHVPVEPELGAASSAWQLVGPYLRQYGSGALSSSTLWNPEFIHMFVPGMGSQPYVVGRAYHRTIIFGVGDPLAHPQHWPEMVEAFKRAFPAATYAHIGPDFGRLLHDRYGLVVNDMGAETNILVQRFNYSKKTRQIRQSAQGAKKAGVAVRELRAGDLTPRVCDQLAHVTGDWVQQKAVGDNMLRVFIRHLDYDNIHLDHGVRLFVAERDVEEEEDEEAQEAEEGETGAEARGGLRRQPGRRIEGFVLVDPMWRDGQVFGYVTSLNRMRRDGHPGTLKLLYDDIISISKSEGKEVMTFGFSPFFNQQLSPFRGALWVEIAGRFLFNFGNNLYQFKNLAFSKSRYGGAVEGDSYKDPNVTMTHVYGGTHCARMDMGMLDLYVMLMYVGFFGNTFDTLLKLAGLRTSLGNSFSDDCSNLARTASSASLASLASQGSGALPPPPPAAAAGGK